VAHQRARNRAATSPIDHYVGSGFAGRSQANSEEPRNSVFERSRDLYRELKPLAIPDPRRTGRSDRLLLSACERSVVRIARELPGDPRPARQLFAEVRFLFPVQQQLNCYRIIDRHLTAALTAFEADGGPGGSRLGVLRCASVNRRGRPCARQRRQGSLYCPSHRHFEEPSPMADEGVSAA